MKRIADECKRYVFRTWSSTLDEDVAMLTITADFRYIVKAMAEVDENKYPLVGLRVIEYGKCSGWELDAEAIEDVYANCLIPAITKLQGRHCGDMYFCCECGTERIEIYDTVYDCMCYLAERNAPVILDCDAGEFEEIFDLLKPGDYLIHIS